MKMKMIKLLSIMAVLAMVSMAAVVITDTQDSSAAVSEVTGPLTFKGEYTAQTTIDGVTAGVTKATNVGLGNNILVSYDAETKTYTVTGTLAYQSVTPAAATAWAAANDSMKVFYADYQEHLTTGMDCGLIVASADGTTTFTVTNSEGDPSEATTELMFYLKTASIAVKRTVVYEGVNYFIDFSKVTLVNSTGTNPEIPFVAVANTNALADLTTLEGNPEGTDGASGKWEITYAENGSTLTLTNYNGFQYFSTGHINVGNNRNAFIKDVIISGSNSITIDVFGTYFPIIGQQGYNGSVLEGIASITPNENGASLNIGATDSTETPEVGTIGIYFANVYNYDWGTAEDTAIIGDDTNEMSLNISAVNRSIYAPGGVTIKNTSIEATGGEKVVDASSNSMELINSSINAKLSGYYPNGQGNDDVWGVRAATLTLDAQSTIVTDGLCIKKTSGVLNNNGKIVVNGGYTQKVGLPAGLYNMNPTDVLTAYSSVPSQASYLALGEDAEVGGNVIVVDSSGAQHVSTEAALIEAVTNGGSIKLDADIELTQKVQIDKAVVIDGLKGTEGLYKLTCTGDGQIFVQFSYDNIIQEKGIAGFSTGEVKFTNLDITVVKPLVNEANEMYNATTTVTDTKVTFSNCNVTATTTVTLLCFWHVPCTLTIEDCSFVAGSSTGYAITFFSWGTNGGKVDIKGTTFDGNFNRIMGTTCVNDISITDSEVLNLDSGKKIVQIDVSGGADPSTVTLTDLKVSITDTTIPAGCKALNFHESSNYTVESIDVEGLVNLEGEMTGTGVTIPADKTFKVKELNVNAGAKLVNNGVIELAGESKFTNAGTISGNGTIEVKGTTVLQAASVLSGTMNVTGTLNLADQTLTIAQGGKLSILTDGKVIGLVATMNIAVTATSGVVVDVTGGIFGYYEHDAATMNLSTGAIQIGGKADGTSGIITLQDVTGTFTVTAGEDSTLSVAGNVSPATVSTANKYSIPRMGFYGINEATPDIVKDVTTSGALIVDAGINVYAHGLVVKDAVTMNGIMATFLKAGELKIADKGFVDFTGGKFAGWIDVGDVTVMKTAGLADNVAYASQKAVSGFTVSNTTGVTNINGSIDGLACEVTLMDVTVPAAGLEVKNESVIVIADAADLTAVGKVTIPYGATFTVGGEKIISKDVDSTVVLTTGSSASFTLSAGKFAWTFTGDLNMVVGDFTVAAGESLAIDGIIIVIGNLTVADSKNLDADTIIVTGNVAVFSLDGQDVVKADTGFIKTDAKSTVCLSGAMSVTNGDLHADVLMIFSVDTNNTLVTIDNNLQIGVLTIGDENKPAKVTTEDNISVGTLFVEEGSELDIDDSVLTVTGIGTLIGSQILGTLRSDDIYTGIEAESFIGIDSTTKLYNDDVLVIGTGGPIVLSDEATIISNELGGFDFKFEKADIAADYTLAENDTLTIEGILTIKAVLTLCGSITVEDEGSIGMTSAGKIVLENGFTPFVQLVEGGALDVKFEYTGEDLAVTTATFDGITAGFGGIKICIGSLSISGTYSDNGAGKITFTGDSGKISGNVETGVSIIVGTPGGAAATVTVVEGITFEGGSTVNLTGTSQMVAAEGTVATIVYEAGTTVVQNGTTRVVEVDEQYEVDPQGHLREFIYVFFTGVNCTISVDFVRAYQGDNLADVINSKGVFAIADKPAISIWDGWYTQAGMKLTENTVVPSASTTVTAVYELDMSGYTGHDDDMPVPEKTTTDNGIDVNLLFIIAVVVLLVAIAGLILIIIRK